MDSAKANHVGTAYVLWLGCLFGLAGLHRLYNGKIFTGIVWLLTWGLCGFGQLVDLLVIPNMVEDYNTAVGARSPLAPADPFALQPAVQAIATLPQHSNKPLVMVPDPLNIQLLQAAADRGGMLTVTQAVMATGLGFREAEALLLEMVRTGYVEIANDPVTGTVIYDFKELNAG